tara:strand:- start:622 stop:1251 length:630 start_codon:yes stop_codon:yes gene_type:complete
MFTGIIKSLGEIKNIEINHKILKLVISSTESLYVTTNIGDSVSVNGVCLTAVKKDEKQNLIYFDVVKETMEKTNLDSLKIDDKVNLESPLKMSDGLDGHIVQGHIDSTGIILSNNLEDESWLLKVKINKKWLKYCILKGSIAIDGISLTISNIDQDYDDIHGAISISIIPHTLEHTNLKYKKSNDLVNIETDFFAKYIEKLLPKEEKDE